MQSGAPAAPAPQQGYEAQQGATDGREVHRWVVTTLMNAGYRCNEDTPTHCMTADDQWIVEVATRVEPDRTLIMLDSMWPRAADKQCAQYNGQMTALTSQPDWFNVSCNDSSARFRMNTTLIYNTQLDMPAWMEQHRKSRYAAYTQLAASGGLQR